MGLKDEDGGIDGWDSASRLLVLKRRRVTCIAVARVRVNLFVVGGIIGSLALQLTQSTLGNGHTSVVYYYSISAFHLLWGRHTFVT